MRRLRVGFLLVAALTAGAATAQPVKRSCGGGQTLPCFIAQSLEIVQDFDATLSHHLLVEAQNLPFTNLFINYGPTPLQGEALFSASMPAGQTTFCTCGTFPCNFLNLNPDCKGSAPILDPATGEDTGVDYHYAPQLGYFRTIGGVPCTLRVFLHLSGGESLYWDVTSTPDAVVVETELGPGDQTVFEGYGYDIPAGDVVCGGPQAAPFSRTSAHSLSILQMLDGPVRIVDNEVGVAVQGYAVYQGRPFFLALLPDASGSRLLSLTGGPPLPPYVHCGGGTCPNTVPTGVVGDVILDGDGAAAGSVTVRSLRLNGVSLYVNGSLTIEEGLSGLGAVFVNGDLVVRGPVNLSTDDRVAIQAQGSVHLCGVRGRFTSGPCAASGPSTSRNLGFAADLRGWGDNENARSAFSDLDASGAAGSGSARVTNPGTLPDLALTRPSAEEIAQLASRLTIPNAVRVTRPAATPLAGGSQTGTGIDQPCVAATAGTPYDLSVKIRIPPGQENTGSGRAVVSWFSDSTCFTRAGVSTTPAVSPSAGAWQTTSSSGVLAPAGTQRAILGLSVEKDDPTRDFQVQFDDVSLAPAAVQYGNLNGDVPIDVFDLVTMASHIVGNAPQGVPPFVAPLAAADVNRSGLVDVFDLVVLAGFIVGNVPSLPL